MGRTAATSRTARTAPAQASGRSASSGRANAYPPRRQVFVFAGQSNMSAYSPMGILQGSGFFTNPGSPGSAPDYVPGYQQTAGNEWTGASPVSNDSSIQYAYPTLAANPCLYVENVSGQLCNAVDGWGSYEKNTPSPTIQVLTFAGPSTGGTFTLTFSGQTTSAIAWNTAFSVLGPAVGAALEALSNAAPNSFQVDNFSYAAGAGQMKVTYYGAAGKSASVLSSNASGLTGTSPTITVSTTSLYGATQNAGSYGPELAFLQSYRAAHPGVPMAAIKQSLGGTGLRSDWLPSSVTLGTAQAGSSISVTLASSDFGSALNYVGAVIQITGGTGVGSTAIITAFNASTKVATVASWSGASPTTGSTYGIERTQFLILRTMIQQAAARLDISHGPGNWEWAGFVWMQGESGAHSASTAANDSVYLSDSRGLYAAIRSLTANPNLPVVIGRIGDNWGWETTPNPFLSAIGYPYAAINSSNEFNLGHAGDGRIDAGATVQASFLAGAAARRATQATLGSDPNCIMYSTDGLPIMPCLWQQWATFNSQTIATSTVGQNYGYHFAGPGNLTAGERAYSAWHTLTGG